jgi:hypothetical protein
MQVDLAGHALVEPQFGEIVGFALAVTRLLCELEQFLVRDQGQPGIGDFGHQHQLRGRAVLLDAEVVLQRRASQAAHPAEEIQFECGHAQAGGVAAREFALPGGRHRGRRPPVAGFTHRIDGGHEIRAADSVLRAGGLDIERRDAQVPVVVECAADQILQLGIGKELAPADVRGGNGVVARSGGPVVDRHRCRRPFVSRRQRTTPEHRGQARGQARGQRRADHSFEAAHALLAYGSSAGVSSTFMVMGFTLK